MANKSIKEKTAARDSGLYQNKHTTHSNKKHVSHQSRIDFGILKEKLKPHMLALLNRILPGGKIQGHEYIDLNPRRNDRTPGSFKFNTCTGKWQDFSTGDKGGDIIALWAYVKGIRQIEAARELQSIVGGAYD